MFELHFINYLLMDLSSWLWIALFIAFILGWVLARYDIKSIKTQNKQLPSEYFKGLQHLLNEQPDKAIDAFIQVAKLDPETVDLHFALGQMFRKRGEFNRSIRIHESLSGQGLSLEAQNRAYIALGEDYYKAGMFDRAEHMFTPFINHENYHNVAIKYLLIIAKLEQDWLKAVDLAKYLPNDKKDLQIFHLTMQYIEVLIQDIKYKSVNKAEIEQQIISIKEQYQHHARLLIDKSMLLFMENNLKQGLDILLNLVKQQPNMLVLVVENLNILVKQGLEASILSDFFNQLQFLNLDTPAYYRYMYQYTMQKINIIINDNISGEQQQNILLKQANSYLNTELEYYPSYELLKRYAQHIINFAPNNTNTVVGDINILFLNKILDVLSQNNQHNYLCHECGFRAKNFSWACHGCGEWESLKVV